MEFFFDDVARPPQRISKLFLAASRGEASEFVKLLADEDPQVLVNGMNCLHIACKVLHAITAVWLHLLLSPIEP